jgi:AP-1 complex subunit sigma 1/2
MWKLLDDHMTIDDCEVYQWAPEDDPFEGEEGALWSYHFFFYNKGRKRVSGARRTPSLYAVLELPL